MISPHTSPESLETFTARWVTFGGMVAAHNLWKISKPGVDLVLYTPVEPVAGAVVMVGDFYTQGGVRIAYDTIPDGMSALIPTTKNVELVTENFPDWFCAVEGKS